MMDIPDRPDSGWGVEPNPPPENIRYPAAMRFVWRSIVAATVAGASLGFGTFAVAFTPESPLGYISFLAGVAVATFNLTKGTRVAARHAFFCGQADGVYRFALALQKSRSGDTIEFTFAMDPTYPEDEWEDSK